MRFANVLRERGDFQKTIYAQSSPKGATMRSNRRTILAEGFARRARRVAATHCDR